MIDFYVNASVYVQVFIATLMTWAITSLGAALVFFFKKVNKNILDGMLGLSAGVMIAASFWSLLNPAIEKATELNMNAWLVALIGLIFGTSLLLGSDFFLKKKLKKKYKGKESKIRRSMMLIFSITLHNIPEGLAIGVAFGGVAAGSNTLLAAVMLATGIGIQNLPEGTAVSLPLRREGFSRGKSFVYGMMSGIVEPISALIGAWLVTYVVNILPVSLAFAAGAMLYVAVSELIPESQNNDNKNFMTVLTICGFAIMMVLDVALG